MTKGLVYYTNHSAQEKILLACQAQLKRCMEIWKFPIVSVSQKPINFGQNFVMNKMESSVISMYKQILKGLQECKTDIVFLVEHDVLYHPSHFDFTPEREDHFYYNRNEWHISSESGKAVFYVHNNTTELSAFKETLIAHIKRAIEVNTERFHSSYGIAPPKGIPPEERKEKYVGIYMSKVPNIDIRHPKTLSRQRMDKSEFRSERSLRGWKESDGVPGWGKTLGRFDEFLAELK
ncbi:hypothetical protein HYT32_02040 [Candidatus Roizmanbacteria bacterium]|nr:hypothetical protein [Candidatus Roizmanbacteria bacterium]